MPVKISFIIKIVNKEKYLAKDYPFCQEIFTSNPLQAEHFVSEEMANNIRYTLSANSRYSFEVKRFAVVLS